MASCSSLHFVLFYSLSDGEQFCNVDLVAPLVRIAMVCARGMKAVQTRFLCLLHPRSPKVEITERCEGYEGRYKGCKGRYKGCKSRCEGYKDRCEGSVN